MPAFAAIVNRFIERLGDKVQSMEDAIQQSDWDQLQHQAHLLKGAGGTVGFDCLTEPAERLEQAAFNRDQTDALGQLAMIQAFSERLAKA